MELYSPKTIKAIKENYGFHNRKSLGQHFLTDPEVVDAIIRAAEIGCDDIVIEIGPGMGVLTREAAALAKEVKAIEIDRAIIPMLTDLLSDCGNVEIICNDILKTDVNEILDDAGYDAGIIIGNLPYYITTPIIMQLFEGAVRAKRIIIMMQKEVAERIQAEPGGKTYGALTVAVRYYCETEEVAFVPRESFSPPPKVDSAVLKLTPRSGPPVELVSEERFFEVVKQGFGQRRKTLRNALASMPYDKEVIERALESAGVDPARRAETLSLEEFAAIANNLAAAQ